MMAYIFYYLNFRKNYVKILQTQKKKIKKV